MTITPPAPLQLQQIANARLMLYQWQHPNAVVPVPVARHVLEVFIGFDRVVGGRDSYPGVNSGDALYEGYITRSAVLPITPWNPWDWLGGQVAWASAGVRSTFGAATVVAPAEGVAWLGDLALLATPAMPPAALAVAPRAQFAGATVLHFGHGYGPGGIGLATQPVLGERLLLVLKPHRVVVLSSGDTLLTIAGRYGTTVQTLRRLNFWLHESEVVTTVAGDTLYTLAGRFGTTVEYIRELNPILLNQAGHTVVAGDTLKKLAATYFTTVDWLREHNLDYATTPRSEPLPLGVVIVIPATRPSDPLTTGQALTVPSVRPSTELPAGHWLHLPYKRRSDIPENPWDEDEEPPPAPPAVP